LKAEKELSGGSFGSGVAKSFSGLLKFSQSQAKFMLSFGVNV
jgi:hypothetical protein